MYIRTYTVQYRESGRGCSSARANMRANLRFWRRQCIAGLATSASNEKEVKLVLGCGSNVVDHIYRVKVVPQVGAKGFFSSPFRALEKRLIGGVTLNHLCWAALGGVPTGLLALQGKDELGRLIRTNLRDLGVATDYITTNSSYSTAQCHVYIQEDGERSIMMAPAATSLINANKVNQYFDETIQQRASMVTTEISQVPLSGVLELLKSAKRAGVLSILDLDIPPLVAEKEAGLGTVQEVVECVKMADVLKPAKAAADELVTLMTGDNPSQHESHNEVAEHLLQLCGSKLVAMTNGADDSVLTNGSCVVKVAPPSVNEVVDTTGAGDAFLGGLIVGITREGGLPTDHKGLETLGKIANAFGATCTQSIGGIPTHTSRDILMKYLPGFDLPQVGGDESAISGFNSSLTSDLAAAVSLLEVAGEDNVSSFISALTGCQGNIFVSGIGKSAAVASRFTGSLSSLSIPAHFVHAAEWIHGDLGKVKPGQDVVVFLSHGGSSRECVDAAVHLVSRGVAILVITSNLSSELAKLALTTLTYPTEEFKEPFQIMPTSTIVVQEMICNGLVCELIQRRGVTKETFLSNHPGGSVGQSKH